MTKKAGGFHWKLASLGFSLDELAHHTLGRRYLYGVFERAPAIESAAYPDAKYVSLSELAERSLFRRIYWVLATVKTENAPVDYLYQGAAFEYAFGLRSILFDHADGLPLYVAVENSGYRELEEADRLKIFIDEAMESNAIGERFYEPPRWALELFAKPKDIELWKVIVGDCSFSPSPDTDDPAEIERASKIAEEKQGIRLSARQAAFYAYRDGKPINRADDSEPEKPIRTRERATLLTLIEALARDNNIDTSHPSKAATAIEALTDKMGARVAARTIEDHLKRIPDAIERRSKPD